VIALARARAGLLLAFLVTVAAITVSALSTPTWLQIVVGVVFLLAVPGGAALSLARAVAGPGAGPDLRFGIAAVVLFMAVIAAGAVYLGFHVKLRAVELVVALAVLAVVIALAAHVLQRRSGNGAPAGFSALRVRVPGSQAGMSAVAAVMVAAAVTVAVTSSQWADASHEFTALGIHPDPTKARPGYTKYSINVISHETATTRYVLNIQAGSRHTTVRIRLLPGATVTQTFEAPSQSTVRGTLALAASPNRIYRWVRFVPKPPKPSTGG